LSSLTRLPVEWLKLNAKAIMDDWVREYNYKKNRVIKSFSLSGNPGEISMN